MNIAKLYASEFVVFLEKKKINLNNDDVMKLIDKIKSDGLIQKYISSQVVSDEKKLKLIQDLTKNSDIIILSKLLMKRSRLTHLVEILSEINKMSKAKSNIKQVVVTSVVKLNDKQIAKVEKLVEKLFKCKSEIKNVISKGIVGGLTIQVEDFLLDMSIRKQFELMEQKISARK